MAEPTANLRTPSTGEMVAVRVSSSIASDYARRDLFPALRIAGVEGAVTFRVSRDLARDVLSDAQLQYQRQFTTENRGTKKSFLHLINALRSVLEPKAVEEEERQRSIARSATQFHVPAERLAGLEVHRYGLRLLNAYGSRAQLIEAAFLPRDFVFPLPTDKEYKRWSDGSVDYMITPRHLSMADQAAQIYGDHYWFQLLDSRYPYPNDFATIWKAEISAGRGT